MRWAEKLYALGREAICVGLRSYMRWAEKLYALLIPSLAIYIPKLGTNIARLGMIIASFGMRMSVNFLREVKRLLTR